MQAELPPGYEVKKRGHFRRNGSIGCGALIVLLVVIIIVGSRKTDLPSFEAPCTLVPQSVAASATPTDAPLAPRLLMSCMGSGSQISPRFNAPGQWQITWSYDCTGHAANFKVVLVDSGGGIVNIPVNEGSLTRSGVAGEHSSGDGMRLAFESDCSWLIAVTTD